MKQKILIVGCGDIGCCLAAYLASKNVEIWGLRRQPDGLPTTINTIAADVTDQTSLTALTTMCFDTVVFTLTPGEASDQRYQQVFVQGTDNVLQAMKNSGLKRILFISSTSVYAQHDGQWVDESSPCKPSRYSGKRLLEAERLCKKTALEWGAACSIIRFAGIYGPGRLRLINAALAAKPFDANFSNRIHRDDCAGFLAHLIELSESELRPCYIGVDDQPVLITEVVDWLTQQLGCAVPPRLNSSNAAVGKRCSNSLMKAAGYELKFANYQQGYTSILTDLNYTQ